MPRVTRPRYRVKRPDRLGSALLRQAADAANGEGAMLREVIDQVRIGAVTDLAGNIRRVQEQ